MPIGMNSKGKIVGPPGWKSRGVPEGRNPDGSLIEDYWEETKTKLETTVVNIKDHPEWKSEGGVYIGRGFRGQRGSTFANPFRIGKDGNRGVVIQKYRDWLTVRLESHSGVADEMESLRGKVLVCWCAPEPCHGDVIKELLDSVE